MNNLDWLDKWKGRTFKCVLTGEILTIPDDVRPRQFFSFGECFLDIGDGCTYRKGGHFTEIISRDDGEE